MKTRILLALGVILALMLSGCGLGDKANEPFKDGPRSGTVNRNYSDIIENPDGFSNLSTKCDHGNRVYVAYHGNSTYAALAVVPADPTCS